MSPRRWQDRIQDILTAIAEIESFTAGMSREQFLADPKTLKAVVADLTILGEAATQIPEDVVQANPTIPWTLMRGMRNRIVHEYFQIRSRHRMGHLSKRFACDHHPSSGLAHTMTTKTGVRGFTRANV